MRVILTVTLALLTVLYPVAVYFSLEHFSPRIWGGLLLGLFALRLWLHRQHSNGQGNTNHGKNNQDTSNQGNSYQKSNGKQNYRQHNSVEIARWSSLAAIVAALWMLVGDSAIAMRSYPVLVSATLAIVFGFSLLYPPTIIERFARLQDPNLPPAGVAYTRKVTFVWLGFFVINGGIAAYTAYWGTMEQWTLYNGLISYGLMGSLFAIEWVVRQSVIKQAESS